MGKQLTIILKVKEKDPTGSMASNEPIWKEMEDK